MEQLQKFRAYLESINEYSLEQLDTLYETDIIITVGGNRCKIPFCAEIYYKICEVVDTAIEEF